MYMYKYVVGIRNVDLDLKTRAKRSEVENRSGKQTHKGVRIKEILYGI